MELHRVIVNSRTFVVLFAARFLWLYPCDVNVIGVPTTSTGTM